MRAVAARGLVARGLAVLAPLGWRRLLALGAVVLLALGGLVGAFLGTGDSASDKSRSSAARAARGTGGDSGQSAQQAVPAYDSGGACQLLDYGMIYQALGLNFAIAASGRQGDTYTCSVQPRGAAFPDLSLSVTPTKADDKVFKDVVFPTGATAVTGLGKAAYSVSVAPAGQSGPGIEVGWLTGSQRLMALRVRLDPSVTAQTAADLGPKLADLARNVDFTSA